MFDAVARNIGFLMGGFGVTLQLSFFALTGAVCLPVPKQLINFAEILPGRIATDRRPREMIQQ